jgi:N-acetylglucosaminyl-diphospho-decaprenol L-rhamnosyltransferase
MIAVSIVSHGHFELIKELGVLATIVKDNRFKIFLTDNIGEPKFQEWCEKYSISYTKNRHKLGFGSNNNLNFVQADKILQTNFEYFIVLNPDLIVDAETLYKLKQNSRNFSAPVSTINLFLDREMSISEDSIRRFPTEFTMIKSLFFRGASTKISKSSIDSPVEIDWCAGCLMGFTPDHYRALSGFDEKYFMYCEDIDICYRSSKLFGKRVVYFPDLKGVHLADRRSRNIFSLHFYWHLVSALRFLYRRHLY